MGIDRERLQTLLAGCQQMWRAGDWDGYADLFAADATFVNSAMAEPLRGSEALRNYTANVPNCDNRTEWLVIDGNRLVFGWNERQEGMRADAPAYRGISTYVFNDAGLVASYEGMFDPAAVAAATAP